MFIGGQATLSDTFSCCVVTHIGIASSVWQKHFSKSIISIYVHIYPYNSIYIYNIEIP